jgi:ferredoxin--NADP+ reductase
MTPAPVISIVGAGPAGFYVAEALLQALPGGRLHLFERAAAPHGLVRYGVAPDHQKLKQVAAVFDGIAGHARLQLHAGVEIGRDLALDALRAGSHAVVLTHGAALGRRLGIAGESLPQVFSAAAFVGWYNGHAEHAGLAPDLAVDSAAIVGHGNVALDVCRLLVRSFDDLAVSDIPQPMLQAFRQRGIREVHLLGRGGPGSMKFTFKEFRQLADLPNVRIRLPQADSFTEAMWEQADSPDARRVLQWLRAQRDVPVDATDGRLTVNLWFHATPAAFVGAGTLRGVRLRSGLGAGQDVEIACGIAVTCVGFASRAIPGAPGCNAAGHLHHRAGQVLDEAGHAVPGLFVAGWAKRGPSGIIGTNRACGDETAATLLATLPALLQGPPPQATDFGALLQSRGIATFGHASWCLLDAHERAQGAALGKPREKLLSLDDALRTLATLAPA